MLWRRATRISDHKGRCLWSGLIRVSRSEAGPPAGGGAADAQKLSAFAVQDCMDSEEAALKLSPLLEASIISADEAGAPDVPHGEAALKVPSSCEKLPSRIWDVSTAVYMASASYFFP